MKTIGNIIKIGLVLLIAISIYFTVPNRQLNVNYIGQYPNMPNGCEITSLTMLMNYNGYNVSKENMDSFLKKTGFTNADPNKAYIGSPYKNGYYCYAQPITDAANEYFKKMGVSTNAKDKTGMSILGVLSNVVIWKKPVAVWYTLDDKAPEYGSGKYTDQNGKENRLYSNLHCVVVEGTNMGKVKVVDPIKGKREINVLQFTKLYYQMGQRAVVI